MDDRMITVQTVTINSRDGVRRQGVNIIIVDRINVDDDLEVCGYLSDSDVLSSVRTEKRVTIKI